MRSRPRRSGWKMVPVECGHGSSQGWIAEGWTCSQNGFISGCVPYHSPIISRKSPGSSDTYIRASLHIMIIEALRVCRNIRTLFNFDPQATEAEIRDASLQFVRKISGFRQPSKANERSFLAAVDEIAHVSTNLLQSLETNAQPRTREQEIAKAKTRSRARFP